MRARVLVVLVLAGCAGGGVASSTSGTGGAGAASTSSTSSTSGAGGATGACAPCDDAGVDTANDPRNCGACGHACAGASPLCDHGACTAAPCGVVGPICPLDHLCCGMECCPPWKMCCNLPDSTTPTCIAVDAGACPTSCR